MPEALALLKRELGPDAVILGTRTLDGRFGRKRVEITAGPARPDANRSASRRAAANTGPARAARPVGVDALPGDVEPLFVELVQNEVAEALAAQIVRAARDRVGGRTQDPEALRAALREHVASLIPTSGGIELDARHPRRIAFVGPAGGGKTTTIAKLAAQFRVREARRVGVLTLDVHRVGAVEQLERYAEVLDVQAAAAQSLSDVQSRLRDWSDLDLILLDTPGLGSRDRGRFARVAAMLRAAKPHETHLVLPTGLLPSAQEKQTEAFAPLGANRLVLTRLDEAVGLGVILTLVQRVRWSVSYVSTGQNVPMDLEMACGRRLSELICRASK